MRLANKMAALALVLAATSAALAGCGSSAQGSGGGAIKLGVSLALSGPLGSTGTTQRAGYQLAVDRVNEAGGLVVGGSKRKVQLVVMDNKSDANLAGQQARQMVLKDGVVGLLSGCTPTITVPAVQVAEVQKIPMIVTCNPIGVFSTFSKSGLRYTWDMFFSETEQAAAVYKTFDQTQSNKRVALFTDTEPDGIAQRALFTKAAQAAGYEIAGDYSFAVGTTDYSSFIKDAKAKGAQLVISQTIIPDGIALYKQIKALGLRPVAAMAAKAGSTSAWPKSLSGAGDGTLTSAYWVPGGPLTAELQKGLTGKLPTVPDQGIAVSSFSAAEVLLDAIKSAGTTDAAQVNKAVGSTDLDSPVGKVTFDQKAHSYATPFYVMQWQGLEARQVYPQGPGAAQLAAPVAGLQ